MTKPITQRVKSKISSLSDGVAFASNSFHFVNLYHSLTRTITMTKLKRKSRKKLLFIFGFLIVLLV
jgi:hypothetical protein